MIRPGEVYKFQLKEKVNGIDSGVRWGIVVDINPNSNVAYVVVIAYENNGNAESNKVYLNLEFDKRDEISCILTDSLFAVATKDLYGKIGHIPFDKLEIIREKSENNRRDGILYEKSTEKQDITDFFRNARLRIPVKFESEDFKFEVNKFLSDYVWLLSQNGVNPGAIEKIKNFRDAIDCVISNYLMGIHSEALKQFETAIETLCNPDSALFSSELDDEFLFRGRINNDEGTDFDDGEMFHIPLNKRGLVDTQRFSFPGLPCLYLGASAYTCWTEMGRPRIDGFQVAAIKPNIQEQRLKVIDLSNIPNKLGKLIKHSWFDEEEYYLYWPLMALCSIKVRHEKDKFKPEYILPQFFLEYVLKKDKSNKYVGVKYISIKTSEICSRQLDDDWHTYVCYVLPSHSDSMNIEKCRVLDKQFKITSNRSGKELSYLISILSNEDVKVKVKQFGQQPSAADNYKELLRERNIYTHDGKKVPYVSSIFGMLELAVILDEFDVVPGTACFVCSEE